MKWLAPLVVGIAALGGGFGFGLITGPAPSDPNLVRGNPYTVLVAVAFYGVFLMAILGLVAGNLRRLAISARAREWQTERALGRTLRSVVASEARLGLRHGVLASGALLVLGATARQFLPWFDGYAYVSGGHFQFSAVAGLALVLVMCVGTTVAVYVVAALTAAGAAQGPAAVPSSVRPSRALGRWGRAVFLVGAGLYPLSTAALMWRRIVPIRWDLAETQSGGAYDYPWVSLAGVVFALGSVVVVTGTVAALAGLISRGVGRVLMPRGRGVFLQAGDALARPSTERHIALGTMTIVLGLVTWISAASDISATRNHLADQFAPLAIVTPAALADQETQAAAPPEGYPAEALPQIVVKNLTTDKRLVAVPFAYLRADTRDVESSPNVTCGAEPCDQPTWREDTYVVVDSDAMTRLAPDGLRPFGFAAGVTLQGTGPTLMSAAGSPGPTWLTVDGDRYPIYRSNLNAAANFIDAAWVRSRFGEPPVTGVWINLARPGDLTDQQRLDTINAILDEAIGGGTAVGRMSFSYGYDSASSNDGVSLGGIVAVALGLLLSVALIGGLAARSARDRRRDLATMAALGASPRTLRMAPVAEMLVSTLSAAAAGVGAGAVLAILSTHPTLFAPGAPLAAGDTLWLLRWNAAHISWTPIGAAVLAAVALTTAVAAVVAVSMARRTPVDELRDAIKEGSL